MTTMWSGIHEIAGLDREVLLLGVNEFSSRRWWKILESCQNPREFL